ncbi:hypothetical protein [Catenuloplanes japonicus]|uniref:hypothetical protein n=1 Tax=Catenuloplanes japonicus TaxID=33876 RepID=UPI000524A641|nr:hypothetical protein [Catenuloplanes japonicus]
MDEERIPVRRVQVGADLEGYSRLSNRAQDRAQELFQEMLWQAAADAGLARTDWVRQASGDGEIAILPAGVDEMRVTGRFVPAIDGLLREWNRAKPVDDRLRMRVAVHQGLVHLDGVNGFPGGSVVHLARLLDAPVLKRALAAYHGASVALALSSEIYRDVCSYPGGLRLEWFREVVVDIPAKGFKAQAWISVLGEDVNQQAWPVDGPQPDAPKAKKSGRRATYQIGDVSNDGQMAVGDGASAIGKIEGRWR